MTALPRFEFVFAMLLLAATNVAAQPLKPEVMAAPLSLRRVPAGVTTSDKERLQREFTRQLKLAGAVLPSFEVTESALRGVKGQDCSRDDACLAALAKRASVLYGLFASIDVTVEGQIVATARVVRDDGEVVRPLVSVSRARGQARFVDEAVPVLVELVNGLSLATLPPQRPVAPSRPTVAAPVLTVPEKVAELPPPPPMVVAAEPVVPVRPKPTAPWVLIGTGAGVAVAGSIVGLVGYFTQAAIPRTEGVLHNPDDAASFRQGSIMATAGLGAIGVGVIGALIGTILLGIGNEPTVSVAPLGQHLLVTFGGRL